MQVALPPYRPMTTYRLLIRHVLTVASLSFGMLVLVGKATAQGQASVEVSPVYRCPGPPVVYTDEISTEEAKRKNCRQIEGAPPSASLNARGLSPEQVKICTKVSDMGFDIASRRARGWTKDEQIQHYRKEFDDSDAMVVVNELLKFVYGPAMERSSPAEYRKTMFRLCRADFQSPSKRRQ